MGSVSNTGNLKRLRQNDWYTITYRENGQRMWSWSPPSSPFSSLVFFCFSEVEFSADEWRNIMVYLKWSLPMTGASKDSPTTFFLVIENSRGLAAFWTSNLPQSPKIPDTPLVLMTVVNVLRYICVTNFSLLFYYTSLRERFSIQTGMNEKCGPSREKNWKQQL